MSRKRIILIHIFIWLFALFANLPFSNLGKSMPAAQVVTDIIAFLYLMMVFYLFYLLIVPLFLEKKKLNLFFIYSFILVLVMPFIGYNLLYLVRAIFDKTFHDFYRGYSFKVHMSGYFPVLTAAVFGSFFRVIINWFTTMNQKAELDRQNLSMQLDLLKGKMNPHFLFNTLNNIDSLIQTDQKAASEALIRLSDIMRYMTYETYTDKVELKREVEYLKNLLELHRLRISNPYEILFEVNGYMKTRIAPALFVPLIENAFKFASFRGEKPAIKISLTSACGIIIFYISNYYDKAIQYHENNYSGSGLANLRKRLELVYPGKHTFEIFEESSIFMVKLTIDTNDY
jgi:two-component system, LytTR family, sensor kinase